MKRLLSILFNVATALSLALFAAIVPLWVRSYARLDSFGYSHNAPPGLTAVDWGYHLTSTRGVLTLGHYVDHFNDSAVVASQGREHYPSKWNWTTIATAKPADKWVGFSLRRNTYPYGTNRNWQVIVPHALPCVLAAALPLMAFVRHRSRRRRRALAGACSSCGYDLRATPDRCPECGTIPA
jgi:hypothetical protein